MPCSCCARDVLVLANGEENGAAAAARRREEPRRAAGYSPAGAGGPGRTREAWPPARGRRAPSWPWHDGVCSPAEPGRGVEREGCYGVPNRAGERGIQAAAHSENEEVVVEGRGGAAAPNCSSVV